jgi:hypothetical protein
MIRMKEQDRERVRRMANTLAKANARRERLAARILSALPECGPPTRDECAAIVGVWRSTEDRKLYRSALSRLMRDGQVRERPMIDSRCRGARVAPVVVLELVEQGSATA